MADAKRESEGLTEQEFIILVNVLQKAHREKAELEARIELLAEALRNLQSGMRNHIDRMGTIAPTHPTIYQWKDYVDETLDSLGEHLKKEEEA